MRTLRHDPLIGAPGDGGEALGAARGTAPQWAGQSTVEPGWECLSRNHRRYHKIKLRWGRAVARLFVDLFLEGRIGRRPSQITLDLDATDDPLHLGRAGKGRSFMATTNPIVTCRCIFLRGGQTCFAPKLRRFDIEQRGPVEEVARDRAQSRGGGLAQGRILLRADSRVYTRRSFE